MVICDPFCCIVCVTRTSARATRCAQSTPLPGGAGPRPAGSIRAARLQCARRDPSPARPDPVCAPRLQPVRRDAGGARDPARRSSGSRPRGPAPRRSATSIPMKTGSGSSRSPSRSSSSASAAWSWPRAPLGCGACSPTGSTAHRDRPRDRRLHVPPRRRRRRHLVPVAVRPAARSGIPRAAHRGRGRRAPGRHGQAVALGRRCATPSPTSRGSARSSPCSGSRPPSPVGPSPTTSRCSASSVA